MSFPDAAAFLVVTTFKNRVLSQLRRLKKPKYLVFTALGLFYFWAVFARRLFHHDGPAGSTAAASQFPSEILLVFYALLGLVYVITFGWIMPGDRAELFFSESEIQFFFAGPVSRRALIHFRLIRALLISFLSAIFLGLWRKPGPNMAFVVIGLWISLGTLSLHMTASGLTRQSLAEHGVAGWRRRILTVAVIVAAAGAVVAWAVGAVGAFPDPLTGKTALDWGTKVLAARPIQILLFPLLAPMRVIAAPSAGDFLRAIPGALGVLAAHYVWAVSSNVAFEQSSAEASERRARSAATRGQGVRVIRKTQPLFRLNANGAPWVAIVWKNFVASTRSLSPRLILVLAILIVSMLAVMVGTATAAMQDPSVLLSIAAMFALGIAAFLAVLGPSMTRSDLRSDIKQIDILRSWPLDGRSVVVAEITASATLLVGSQWILVVIGTLLSFGGPTNLGSLDRFVTGFIERISIALGACLLLASITVAGLILRNAIVLYLPAWASTDEQQRARGPEAAGQRLLTLVGTLLVILVAFVPATLVGGAVGGLLFVVMGVPAIGIGAAVASAVVAGESWLAVTLLGRAFERFDLSET